MLWNGKEYDFSEYMSTYENIRFDGTLSPEESALSYSKYFYFPTPEIDPVIAQVIFSGPIDHEKALKPEDIERLFDPGYLPTEEGYCVFPDGAGYVSNYVNMPGVSIEMIDWWLSWHFIQPPSVPKKHGNLRYKIWHPEEHWDTGPADEETLKRRLDKSLPNYEHFRNTHEFIVSRTNAQGDMFRTEALGLSPEKLGIDPAIMNNRDFKGTAATGFFANKGMIVVHYYRPNRTGIELRSRYWFGYKLENDRIVRDTENFPSFTDAELIPINRHNAQEYPRLAAFLPSLYAEEGWKDIDVY